MKSIPFARPMLGQPEIEAAARAIRSGWVTQGPEVAAFEREFADFVGAPHACAVSNCTAALHLALRAVGVGPGDEVVTVSHSFIATANAVRYCGALPVFVDVQRETLNMDPALIERALSPRTRAILCVHQLGMPCDLAGILEVARSRSLPVVEDAACAIGSEIVWNGAWERIGRPHGDIACFSFHPRKLLTTGDGGMITTSNEEWDRRFRLWRQHGMSVPDTVRHAASKVIVESYPVLGYNYRLTDVQAAIGREQLRRLPALLGERRRRAARYGESLAAIAGLRLPVEPVWARTNWQSYAIGIPDGVEQAGTMQRLLDAGIATRRGVMCAHREPAYGGPSTSLRAGPSTPLRAGADWSCPAGRLPESERAQDRVLLLPLYPQMTDEEQDRVVEALESVVGAALSAGAEVGPYEIQP
jgi:dTDP-4-amino-4,6-dideoxygalactose transaminase